ISSTTLTVFRNKQGFGSAHVSGATVICGYAGSFDPKSGNVSTVVGSPTVGASATGATFVGTLPVGACTRSSQAILPVFLVTAQPDGRGKSYGYAADCIGGKWQVGTLPDSAGDPASLVAAQTVPLGPVAYGSLGTSTTDAVQEFVCSINVPRTSYITGFKL